MTSSINPAIPPLGNATTAGVRANFATAKSEIEQLQTDVVTLDTFVKSGFTGFVDPDNITFAWNNVTRTFTLTPIVGSFSFYTQGILHSKSSAQNITIPNVTSNYYLYFDISGNLQFTTTFSEALFVTYTWVGNVFWNATLASAVPDAMLEKHSVNFNDSLHLYLHETVGTAYDKREGGLLPSVIVDASGALLDHIQVAVSGGKIWDEDVEHTISSRVAGDVIPKLYLTGAGAGAWTFDEATSAAVLTTGTGRAAWNQFTGGNWQLTEIANGNFVLKHLYAIPGFTKKWMIIVGRAQYTSLGLAQAGARQEIFDIGQVPLLEFLPVATFVVQTSNTYTNSVKSRFVSAASGEPFIDWRPI